MFQVFQDIYSILWVDLRFLRRNWLKTLATTLMAPLLYLLAFGYGLGRGISIDGFSYLEFVIPGIVALTAMTSSFNAAGMKLHVDRLFYRCFDECLMSPISLFSIIIGKTLIGVIRGLLSSAALIATGYAFSTLTVINPLFMLSLVVTCFVFSFLGVFVALIAKSHQDMSVFMSLVILPMTFLSGTFFSLTQLPEILRSVLYISPLTHASLCLRASALEQIFPWSSMAALLAFGGIFLYACFIVLRKYSV